MRSTPYRRWLAPLSLLLLAACSSTTDERQSIVSTPEDYCQRACYKAHACKDTIDATDCSSACRSAIAAAPKLRADLLAYVATCIESSSCASNTTVKCTSEAKAQLSASDFGKTMCAAYLTAGNQCAGSGESYPESTCLAAAKSYDDAALKVAEACLRMPCSGLNACLSQAMPDVERLP